MREVVRKLALLLLVAALGVGPHLARDWFVNVNSGAADPDGSPNRPYLAISDALNDPFFFPGDTIFVFPGTYNENVVVRGKCDTGTGRCVLFDIPCVEDVDCPAEAHLVSTQGAAVTTIDGGGLSHTVLLDEAGASTVTGFTIRGGAADVGAGLEIFGGSPTISHNIITGNNALAAVFPGLGGGLDAYDADFLRVVDNLVFANHADAAGGGIHLEKCLSPEISFNTLVGNTVSTGGQSYGPGMFLLNSYGNGSVRNNVAANNTSDAPKAGGIELFADNNNTAVEGNLLFQNQPKDLVIEEAAQPLPDGAGNLEADPRFVDALAGPPYVDPLDADGGNYRVLVDSPALDSAVPGVTPSAVDLDANPRPLDGDGNGGAVADRGCFESLGSLSNLVVSTASVVSWGAAFTLPDAYHVYRNTLTGLALGDAGSCQDARDPNVLDTEFPEPDLPALGEGFSFLAGFELGGADSGLGVAGNGVARQPALLCP